MATNFGEKIFLSLRKKSRGKYVRSLPECQIRMLRDMIYNFHETEEQRIIVLALYQKVHYELE